MYFSSMMAVFSIFDCFKRQDPETFLPFIF